MKGGAAGVESRIQGDVGTVTELGITNEGITAPPSDETCNFTTKLMNELKRLCYLL